MQRPKRAERNLAGEKFAKVQLPLPQPNTETPAAETLRVFLFVPDAIYSRSEW